MSWSPSAPPPSPTAAPPPGPDPRQLRRRYRQRSVVGPVLLIALGGIFLLQNMGILPWSAWSEIWKLWPLVLVLVGLELLVGGRTGSVVMGAAAAVIVVAAVGALAVGGYFHVGSTATSQDVTSTQSVQALQGATQAQVTVRFGAGQLHVGPLAGGPAPDMLAQVSYSGPRSLQPNQSYSVSDGMGRFELSGRGGGSGPDVPLFGNANAPSDTLLLSTGVPISLQVQSGAAASNLDLTELNLTGLDVSTGAAATSILLPRTVNGTLSAHVQGGASSLQIVVPQGVAAQIQHQGGLSSFDIDQSRFPSVDSQTYQSAGYASAQNRINLLIDSGVSSVSVH